MKIIYKYIFTLLQFITSFFNKGKNKKPNPILLGFDGISLEKPIWFFEDEFDFRTANFEMTNRGMSNIGQPDYSVIYFKGNPSWEKLFQHFKKKNIYIIYHKDFSNIIQIIKKYKKELYINNIYPSKYYNLSSQNFINEIISFNTKININKEIKKVFNNTDHKMYSHKIYDIYSIYIKEFENLNLITSFLKKEINKTKESSELILSLKSHLNKINNFNYHIIKKELTENNIEIVSDVNNVIIIKTKSFLEMEKFGVNSWCIQSNEKEYKNHSIEKNNQFIIYDFNRLRFEKESIIGVTINIKNNHCIHSFDAYNNKIYLVNDALLDLIK
jgi:hypothetical protein